MISCCTFHANVAQSVFQDYINVIKKWIIVTKYTKKTILIYPPDDLSPMVVGILNYHFFQSPSSQESGC